MIMGELRSRYGVLMALHMAGSIVLGTPVVPFFPFNFGVSLLKQNSRKRGILIIMGLLGNLV